MGSAVKGLDKALAQMDLQKVCCGRYHENISSSCCSLTF